MLQLSIVPAIMAGREGSVKVTRRVPPSWKIAGRARPYADGAPAAPRATDPAACIRRPLNPLEIHPLGSFWQNGAVTYVPAGIRAVVALAEMTPARHRSPPWRLGSFGQNGSHPASFASLRDWVRLAKMVNTRYRSPVFAIGFVSPNRESPPKRAHRGWRCKDRMPRA
jgi:hypothetical protein